MASVLRSQLQDRAFKAEKLIEQMLPLLQRLKSVKAAEVCSKEVTRLRVENAVLQKQVDTFVQQLDNAESERGARQYNRPKKTDTSAAVSGSQPAPAAEKLAAPLGNPPAEKPKKNENKGAKSGGGKKVTAQSHEKLVDISRLLLKVGKIVDVKLHPDADTLYVEQVELGEEKPRQILSGLVKHVPIEQMLGRLAVFACNLKPAKMRGLESHGMIMCASTPDKVQVVDVPKGSVPGDIVTFPGYTGEPDGQLNPKKKIWEALAPNMSTNSACVACWKGVPYTVEGRGVCTADGCPNFPIK